MPPVFLIYQPATGLEEAKWNSSVALSYREAFENIAHTVIMLYMIPKNYNFANHKYVFWLDAKPHLVALYLYMCNDDKVNLI